MSPLLLRFKINSIFSSITIPQNDWVYFFYPNNFFFFFFFFFFQTGRDRFILFFMIGVRSWPWTRTTTSFTPTTETGGQCWQHRHQMQQSEQQLDNPEDSLLTMEWRAALVRSFRYPQASYSRTVLKSLTAWHLIQKDWRIRGFSVLINENYGFHWFWKTLVSANLL